MQHLIQGMESEKKIRLLLSLTKTSSEPTIDALIDHLVKGYDDSTAASINGITASNFNRALANLNKVAGIVQDIIDLRVK